MASRFIDRTYLESRWGADLVALRAGEACGDPTDTAAIDAVIAAAIATAEAEATSYLTRYADSDLPTTPATTPAVLQQNVADLAMYDLSRHHQLMGDELVRGRGDALAWLRSVSRGQANLGLASAPAVDSSAPQILTSKTKADLVFSGPRGIDRW